MDKKDIGLSQWSIVQEAEIGCFWQTVEKKAFVLIIKKIKNQLIYFIWKSQ